MENFIGNRSAHYRTLFAGLAFFALTLPVSKSISSVAIGLIYAYCLVIIAFDKNFRETVIRHIKQPLNVPILLFILIALFRSLFSINLPEGMGFVKQTSNLFIVYLMVSLVISSEHDEQERLKDVENLLLFFLAGIFTLDMLGYLAYFGFVGNKKYVLPFSPLNMHHIWAGNLNAIGLYVSSCLLLFSKRYRTLPRSIFVVLFLVICAISVLISTSRTAWLGILVTAAISAYFLFQRKRTYFLAALSVMTGCVILYVFNNIIHTRTNQIFIDLSLFFSGVTTTSIGLRLLMWKAALEMFVSNPLFGVGPGAYKSTIAGFVSSGRFPESILMFNQPHNMYLFTLAISGLAGLSALFFIFYKILSLSKHLLAPLRRERILGFLALSVLIHFMVAGLTESLLNIHVLISTFAFILGVSVHEFRANS
jgi:O-antigen ligase